MVFLTPESLFSIYEQSEKLGLISLVIENVACDANIGPKYLLKLFFVTMKQLFVKIMSSNGCIVKTIVIYVLVFGKGFVKLFIIKIFSSEVHT
jgi:hypothetical protein